MSYRPDPRRFCVGGDFSRGIDTLFQWQPTVPDNGTWSAEDAINGVCKLTPSDSSVADNDEIYLASQQEPFVFKAGCPIYASCRMQFVEANADRANVIFGLMNAVAANSLIDDGGGPRASGSVCCIYKRETERYWRTQGRDYWDVQDMESQEPAGVISRVESIDGVVTTTTPWQTLEMWIEDPRPPYTVKERVMIATFAVDGRRLPVVHELSIINATEMQLFVGVKNGSAVMETLKVNWLYGEGVRD